MADIATISLKADTSDLERGTQKLKELGDTAEKVDNSARNLSNQFNRGIDSQKKASEAAKRHKKELDDLLDSINPTNKAFQTLDEWQTKLANASKKGLLSSDQFVDYNKILERTRDKLTRVQMSLTTEGQALLAQEVATNRAKKAADDFLNSLKNQTETIGKTRTELLEMRAAQMGISQQAAPLIAKLKEQEKAFMNGSITIGQYKQAMRQLPMQMTDIVTSLASGMPVWLIAIQQGGQIKDSFGGIGNSLKAVTSLITPLNVGLAGAALAVGGLSYATFKAQMAQDAFNRALITSGKYAGFSQREIIGYANTITRAGLSTDSATESLTKLLDAGLKIGVDIGKAGMAIAEFSRYSGKSIDSLVSNFARLSDDPYGGSIALNKQYRYLSASVLQHIKELEDQGKTTEAVTYATDALSGAMTDRTNEIRSSMGTLPSFFDEISRAANKMWDGIMGIGADPSKAEEIAKLQLRIRSAENDQRRYDGRTPSRSNEDLAADKTLLANLLAKNEADKKSAELQERSINNQVFFNQLVDKGTDNTEKRRREHEKLNKAIQDNIELAQKGEVKLWTDEQIKMAREGINKRYETKEKTPKTPTYRPDYGTRADESANQALLSLQAQLKVLKEHKTVADIISSERKKLWDMEAKITILEEAKKTRQLTKDEQSLLLRKESILASQRELAIYGDKVSIQQKLNDEIDKQRQRTDELKARGEALIRTAGLSSRLQQREIAYSSKKTPQDIKDLEEYYAKEDSIRANWELGVKKGFAEFQDQATDVYGNVAQITQSAFQGMSNTVADFFLTSKFNLTDFTKSFLEMTTKMITQMAMLNAMRAGLGGTTFGNFLGLNKFDSGGYTGDGGKYDPKGVVHGGEFVFTREATQRLGIANLYRLMESGKKGYATGGYVGGSAPMSVTQPTAFIARNPQVAGGGNVQVNLGAINIENGQQQQSSNNQANSSSLKRELQQMVESGVNNLLRNPASVLSRTIKGN